MLNVLIIIQIWRIHWNYPTIHINIMANSNQVIVGTFPVVFHQFTHNFYINTQDYFQIVILQITDIYILILISFHNERLKKHQIKESPSQNDQPPKIHKKYTKCSSTWRQGRKPYGKNLHYKDVEGQKNGILKKNWSLEKGLSYQRNSWVYLK